MPAHKRKTTRLQTPMCCTNCRFKWLRKWATSQEMGTEHPHVGDRRYSPETPLCPQCGSADIEVESDGIAAASHPS